MELQEGPKALKKYLKKQQEITICCLQKFVQTE